MGCHNLKKLKNEYDRIYPNTEFELVLPFGYQYLGYGAKEIEKMVKDEPPQDQTFRYHTDREGKIWKGFKSQDGIIAFLPQSFLTTILEFRQRISELGEMLRKDQQ